MVLGETLTFSVSFCRDLNFIQGRIFFYNSPHPPLRGGKESKGREMGKKIKGREGREEGSEMEGKGKVKKRKGKEKSGKKGKMS